MTCKDDDENTLVVSLKNGVQVVNISNHPALLSEWRLDFFAIVVLVRRCSRGCACSRLVAAGCKSLAAHRSFADLPCCAGRDSDSQPAGHAPRPVAGSCSWLRSMSSSFRSSSLRVVGSCPIVASGIHSLSLRWFCPAGADAESVPESLRARQLGARAHVSPPFF